MVIVVVIFIIGVILILLSPKILKFLLERISDLICAAVFQINKVISKKSVNSNNQASKNWSEKKSIFLLGYIVITVNIIIIINFYINLNSNKRTKNSENPEGTIYSISQDANLRSQPVIDENIVKVLPKETKVKGEITEDKKWLKLDDGSGFVSLSLLKNDKKNDEDEWKIWAQIGFWILMLFVFYISSNVVRKLKEDICPYCGHLFGIQFLNKEKVGSHDSTIDKERVAEEYINGHATKKTFYKEAVPAITYVYNKHYKCIYCQKRWYETESFSVRK